MIKLVIFDLDDTLISEDKYIRSGYYVVSKYLEDKYKIDSIVSYNKLISFLESKEKNTFNKLLDEFNIKYSKEDIMKIVGIYRNHIPNICFFDDVMPTINELKIKKIKLGIISDGYLETQKRKLEVLKADEIFDYIILTEELGREFWKPHPKAFEMMLEKFSCNPEDVIYVGDNPEKDFYIKNYIPVNTIRIKRENGIYTNSKYMENIREDVEIYTLTDLLKYL